MGVQNIWNNLFTCVHDLAIIMQVPKNENKSFTFIRSLPVWGLETLYAQGEKWLKKSAYLKYNTALNEVIKSDGSLSLSIKLPHHDVIKPVWQPVTWTQNWMAIKPQANRIEWQSKYRQTELYDNQTTNRIGWQSNHKQNWITDEPQANRTGWQSNHRQTELDDNQTTNRIGWQSNHRQTQLDDDQTTGKQNWMTIKPQTELDGNQTTDKQNWMTIKTQANRIGWQSNHRQTELDDNWTTNKTG